MDPEPIKAKLIGFGMQLLEGIDPNPENYVTAGIIHNTRQQVGVLCRLEPNKQAMVRLTMFFVIPISLTSLFLFTDVPFDSQIQQRYCITVHLRTAIRTVLIHMANTSHGPKKKQYPIFGRKTFYFLLFVVPIMLCGEK